MKQWLRRKERGQMLLLMVLLITGLLGIIGLSVDAGFAYGQRRQAQNGADNAALAADPVVAELVEERCCVCRGVGIRL